MDAGVASGAKGDQEAAADGCPDDDGGRRVSDQTHSTAAAAVAVKNLVAVAGKAAAGMGVPPVTRRSTSRSKTAGRCRRGRKAGSGLRP